MEWIGYGVCGTGSGSTSIIDPLKSKIGYTIDTSSSTVFPQGKNFQTEDTAVHYCALNSHNDTNHGQSSTNPLSGDTWNMKSRDVTFSSNFTL